MPEEALVEDIAWIAVDWGTSNLRTWAMDRAGEVVAEASSSSGMATLDRPGFEPALLALIGDWLPADRRTPVIACGMVGARQGWIEVPYRQVPCTPVALAQIGRPDTRDPRLRVMIVGGLMQARPADVMRGEETQIAGLLLDNPGFDGVLCLPGTHTKWVRVQSGEIVAFQSVMTGELFALLAGQSVLRHSLDGEGWDDAEFARAVSATLADPGGFAGRLFAVRAEALLSGLPAAAARARLSGLLIGAELAATQAYWRDADATIVGNGAQSGHYAGALRAQGRSPAIADTTLVTLSGLRSAWQQLAKEAS
ncbi:MAG: 2-dehydro-3-deoxygalactonokinase [Tardiphaga sp.]|nr:2-dehydro-3-deoxygalactonokinase [Tardiphaga sp.]